MVRSRLVAIVAVALLLAVGVESAVALTRPKPKPLSARGSIAITGFSQNGACTGETCNAASNHCWCMTMAGQLPFKGLGTSDVALNLTINADSAVAAGAWGASCYSGIGRGSISVGGKSNQTINFAASGQSICNISGLELWLGKLAVAMLGGVGKYVDASGAADLALAMYLAPTLSRSDWEFDGNVFPNGF